ncbi:MAG: hypothetical protein IJ094_13130 [Bacilli bacterium]|nr:hypothetical protein [Bacilli bacterium]
MIKEVLVPTLKKAGKVLIEHSPDILLGVAIFGSVSAIGMAIRVTPQAEAILAEEIEKLVDEKKITSAEELKWYDYVRICWKVYLPTGIMLSTSIIATILSNYIRAKRAGALATAFAITQETLRTYQDKVIEEVGKKREEKIRDKVAKEKLSKHDNDGSSIIITGKGDYLIFDAFSGRYFKSNIDEVRRAQNELNAMINRDLYASVNDFYELLGIRGIEAGDTLGWSGGLMKINVSTQMSDKESGFEQPCMVIDFHDFEPFENYKSLH